VANAAFGVPGSAMEMTLKHWDVTMHSSAHSLLRLAQHAVPLMNDGWGRIISITSEGGQRVLPGYGIIGVAKAAWNLSRGPSHLNSRRKESLSMEYWRGCRYESFRAIPGAEEKLREVIGQTPIGKNH